MNILKIRRLSKIVVLISAMALFLSVSFVPKANATTGLPITDGNPVTVQINGSVGVFSITVSNYDTRYISVDSSTPVRTQIVPVVTGLQPFISFNSVDYRVGSRIEWHFIPGTEYTLYVYPQTSPATVTISMSTSGSNGNWVYIQNPTSFTEKNMLTGGKTEFYNFANHQSSPYGIYRITVTTNISNLQASFIDSDGIYPDQTQYNIPIINGSGTFSDKKFYYTYDSTQTNYGLFLTNPNSPSTGGYYIVTVQKVG